MTRKKLIYPSSDAIIHVNKEVNLMSTRKADAHKLLRDRGFIDIIIDGSNNTEGDLYDKSAVLLRELVVRHGFASGNKRTAFIVTAYFITKNGGKVKFKYFDKVEKILRNIRLYNIEEIAEWLRKGEIDETKFER